MVYLVTLSSHDLLHQENHQVHNYADVTRVMVSGPTGNYTFRVTLRSPDKGCSQYADWWEVVNDEGELVYRRILAHSHVSEQPFTRQGGAVKVEEAQNVWIRAHMNNSGYGGTAFYGNAKHGFATKDWPTGFGDNIENQKPQPGGCAF